MHTSSEQLRNAMVNEMGVRIEKHHKNLLDSRLLVFRESINTAFENCLKRNISAV